MSRLASSALERLNALPREEMEARLASCCGSSNWARRLAAERPFRSTEELAEVSDRIWKSLPREDWLEAFAAHPRIGEVAGTGPADLHPQQSVVAGTGPADQIPSKRPRRHSTDWSREEQAGTKSAPPETLAKLAEANRDYEKRFGHVFLVCATGKSAAEMLALAQARLHNDAQTELAIAAEEQRKITRLRLARLLEAEEV